MCVAEETKSPAEMVLSKPHTLIVYKGGCYDGCFWENNFALVDPEGDYVSLYHSGYYGCDTREKMAQRIHNIDVLGDTGMWYRTFDLTDPEQVTELVDEESLNSVITLATWLKSWYDDELKLHPQCEKCETRFDPTADDLEFDYRGNNGIGIEVTGVYCPECVRELTCSKCNSVMEIGHTFKYDDPHFSQVCEYCAEDD